MSQKTGNILDWDLFVRVLALAKPFKRAFVGALALAIILAMLSPIRPYLIQIAIDQYIMLNDGAGLQFMLLLLLIVLVIEASCRYSFIYTANWLGQSVIKQLRVRVFEHIVRFRLRFFDTTPLGTATTRAINDVETINSIFSQGLITIIADILGILTILGIMFYTDWQLALVCLIPLPFLLYATYLFKEAVKASFQEVRTQVSRLNAFLQEHITGMSVVQIFSAEAQEMRKFEQINNAHKQAHVQSIWYYSIFFPVVEIITASALGLLVWYGSNSVLNHTTSLGVLVAFIMYMNRLFRPIRMLADKFNTLQMGLVASERVFSILDRDERIENIGTSSHKLQGRISFEKVWFAYNEVDFVLKDISFELEQGKTLAIVGATGAGKSSIINILSRFYDIQQGCICIDGVNVNDYSLETLRGNIGLVLQDVFLFSGSIYDNITLRNPEIAEKRVLEAAKIVGAHQFIEQLPNGYNYNVMERGATLSMGQRQLISFIRALVFDPKILILDEATSSIDTETEQMVQKAIDRLVANRTAIIIAHRLSTIRKAHKIMVLEKGEIVEIGTHAELLAFDGHYRKLHDTQFAVEDMGV